MFYWISLYLQDYIWFGWAQIRPGLRSVWIQCSKLAQTWIFISIRTQLVLWNLAQLLAWSQLFQSEFEFELEHFESNPAYGVRVQCLERLLTKSGLKLYESELKFCFINFGLFGFGRPLKYSTCWNIIVVGLFLSVRLSLFSWKIGTLLW